MREHTTMATRALILTVVFLGLLAAPAFGHGDLKEVQPRKDADLKRPPGHAYLTFTETPTDDSTLKITDGCGDDVVTKLERFGATLHALLGDGRPGRWTVRYDVISNEDGHQSKGNYSFTVQGARDCSDDEAAPDDDADDAGATLPSEDSNFPVVPVVMGTLVIVGGAILIRAKSSN